MTEASPQAARASDGPIEGDEHDQPVSMARYAAKLRSEGQSTPQQQADALRWSLAVNDGRCPKCDVDLTDGETIDDHLYWMHTPRPDRPDA